MENPKCGPQPTAVSISHSFAGAFLSTVLNVNLTLQNAQTGTFTRSVVLSFSRFFALVFASGPHGFQERLAASQEAMKNKNVVNLGAIRQGMKRFQFLLNCCEPGTIPDASILAAALDLVWFLVFGGWEIFLSALGKSLNISPVTFQEAPVVARASLFLECARFVHRCNRGNWPEWMKGHHVNITKRGLSRGRSPIVGNKRNQKLQWHAAKHFCQWGDVS